MAQIPPVRQFSRRRGVEWDPLLRAGEDGGAPRAGDGRSDQD